MVWRAFKLLLSAALLALAGFFVYLFFFSGFDAMPLGAASVLLFFSAWPWVKHDQPNRSLSLVGIVISLMFAALALHTATGTQFPRLCQGRRVLWCEFENLLFAVGGELLAAVPYATSAVIVFSFSIASLRRGQARRHW